MHTEAFVGKTMQDQFQVGYIRNPSVQESLRCAKCNLIDLTAFRYEFLLRQQVPTLEVATNQLGMADTKDCSTTKNLQTLPSPPTRVSAIRQNRSHSSPLPPTFSSQIVTAKVFFCPWMARKRWQPLAWMTFMAQMKIKCVPCLGDDEKMTLHGG